MQTEKEVFDDWYEHYYYFAPPYRAIAAFKRVVWLVQSGAFVPDNEYHPNQTLEDNV